MVGTRMSCGNMISKSDLYSRMRPRSVKMLVTRNKTQDSLMVNLVNEFDFWKIGSSACQVPGLGTLTEYVEVRCSADEHNQPVVILTGMISKVIIRTMQPAVDKARIAGPVMAVFSLVF